MNRKHATTRISAVVAAATASLAVFAGPASAHSGGAGGTPVFVQTDAVTGNSVVAYSRGADGSLTQEGVYSTGGLGGALNGAVVYHLSSEGSLTYDRAHGLLYAVNAGSNTVTVFAVNGDRLIRRQVISSGGTFPVSIAVHGNLVYVLNALDGGSVQGYLNVAGFLVKVTSWNRSLGLDPDATPQFTHTPGQVGFTPDGSKLIVTTKAVGNSLEVFPVSILGIAAQPVVTSLPGATPFGFTFDPAGRLQLTEAGPNAIATFVVGRNGTLTQSGQLSTGQAATCWVVADGANLYASNAGSGSLTGAHTNADGSLTDLGNTTTSAGTVDAAVSSDGQYLYAQTGLDGGVDAFRVAPDGSLTKIGSVGVPGAVGGEGIAAL